MPYSLDLVLEYSRFSTLPIDAISKPTPTPGSNRQSAPPPQQQQRTLASPQHPSQQQQKGGNADGRFNCTACKKSFGSEATWNSHQMSAKHIATVKDAEKKNKGGSKAQAGQKNNNNNSGGKGRQQKTQEATEEQDPPEVVEALMSFRKVEKIVKENPSMAATVLWKIAKALWSFRQSQETAKVLDLLISVLSELQSAPPSSVPGALSPTQIGMTLYLSRLSMARLVVYHSRSLAFQYYLDAIQGRWQIAPNDFQDMCEMVHTTSASRHLSRCKEYLSTHSKTEKLMSTPPLPTQLGTTEGAAAAAKKPADPNLKLLTVLKESASMLSQTSSGISSATSIDEHVLGETAVTLFAMAAALYEASGDSKGTIDILRKMAVIYNKGLRLTYSAAACLIRSAEIASSAPDGQVEEGIWDLFQALLLAMETGDFVRMQQAIVMLEGRDILAFQDVQTIMEVAQAVISQDNDYLRNTATNSLEYLLLLLQEQGDAAKSELLICRQTSVDVSMAALERMQRLVS
ncbi:hypothetical protein BGX29_008382 [Mortierella sp. GBA35]|nr:hypothetical protein BGX29_008382 [Mortierella sp. GBA35]